MKRIITIILLFINFFLFAQQETAVDTTSSKIYKISEVDVAPEFPGGTAAFTRAVITNIRLPEVDKNINVKFYVKLIINEDGTMYDVVCERDPGYKLGKEAVKAVQAIKTKWNPGMYNGNPVPVMYTFPLSISIMK